MDLKELVPLTLQPSLAWLGTAPGAWLRTVPGKRPENDDRPRTDIVIDTKPLYGNKGADRQDAQFIIRQVEKSRNAQMMVTLAYLEAAGRLLADGPKLFRPTEEQWESMEQVALHLPMRDFRSPFPALVVRIPAASRVRLAKQFGVDINRMPTLVLIRHRQIPGENTVVFLMSKFGNSELYHIIQDQEGNEDIEDALCRKIVGQQPPDCVDLDDRDMNHEYPCSQILGRTVMNLCLMMTHYGYKLGGPVDPVAYAKHRNKKHLQHFKHGDFLSVDMKQEIVVRHRSGATDNPAGPGTGIEVKPHWRKGHWRAYPGQGEARAAGQQVPLLFVKPCVVRYDRVKGDLALSEATYSGG